MLQYRKAQASEEELQSGLEAALKQGKMVIEYTLQGPLDAILDVPEIK